MAESLVMVVRDAEKESTHSFPLSIYSVPGDLRQDPGRAAESPAEAETCGKGSCEVGVLLSTYGSPGDVEPRAGLAVQLWTLGAEVWVCAPPDFADRLAEVGVSLVPAGQPACQMVTGATLRSAADLLRGKSELVAAQFAAVAAAAAGCDALVATGLMPAGARSVAGADEPRRRADRRMDPAGRTPTPGRVGGFPGRLHTAGVYGLRQHGNADCCTASPEGHRPGGHRGDPCATAAHSSPGWADPGIGAAHDGPAPSTESLSAAIGTDGATMAATLPLDVVSRERPPVSA